MSRAQNERQNHRDNPKLPITLYYEALCPYCRRFVIQQLHPSMLRMDRLRYTDLMLVPYGNAKLIDDGDVSCQHGVNECELNAWHACILEHKSFEVAFKLIACMMRGLKNRLDSCATRFNINVSDVKRCKQSRSIADILKKYGDETAEVAFHGVPAIAVDHVYVEDDQSNLSDNFDAVFCGKYEAKFNIRLPNC
ncbi:GH14296 [Drosophila grimshawi]|uniref:GH14296 n=1 Tax=Drosophila grimshawi TaxID=7222 RepID=B4JYH8_DROGR|nr:GH14296 [Drosophila grimshawi]